MKLLLLIVMLGILVTPLHSLGEELSLMLINVGGEFHKTYIYITWLELYLLTGSV